MKKITAILTLAIIALTVQTSIAQNKSYFAFYYSTGLGLADQSDYVSKFSWQGWGMEGRSFVQDDISIGGLWGIQTFYEALEGQVATEGTIAVKGNQYRYINSMPFMFTIHKYFGEPEARIFVGTGIGTYKTNAETQIGLWAVSDDAWSFGVMPELGVSKEFNPDFLGYLSVRYNRAIRGNDLPDWQYMTFNLGFAFQ